MTDPSAINLNIPIGITSDLMLSLKPSAPKSKTSRVTIQSLNKSVFKPQDTIIWEVPTGRKGSYLDQSQSFLKFGLKVKTTAASTNSVWIENTAYSFFQTLTISHGSNQLENINEYGQLCNLLLDSTLTTSDKAGLSNLIGSNYEYNILPAKAEVTTVGQAAPAATSKTLYRAGDRSGMSVSTAGTLDDAIIYNFSLPLMSGIIGVNASKCIPIGELNAPIRCELVLSALDDPLVSNVAGLDWEISGVEFNATYIELYDDMLNQQFQQGIPQYISTNTYRHSAAYLPASSSGAINFLLPFRCASLMGLYACFRPFSTAVNGAPATACYRKSSRINPNFSQYSFMIGSSQYPNRPVILNNSTTGNASEAYAELMKVSHSLGVSTGNSSINYSQYNKASTGYKGWGVYTKPSTKLIAAQTTEDTSNNAWTIGLETSVFANRSDTILSGLSTLNSQVFFNAVVNSGQNVGGEDNLNFTCDFFANMDCIIIIENGLMSAKF